jgi:hypothetical protein
VLPCAVLCIHVLPCASEPCVPTSQPLHPPQNRVSLPQNRVSQPQRAAPRYPALPCAAMCCPLRLSCAALCCPALPCASEPLFPPLETLFRASRTAVSISRAGERCRKVQDYLSFAGVPVSGSKDKLNAVSQCARQGWGVPGSSLFPRNWHVASSKFHFGEVAGNT